VSRKHKKSFLIQLLSKLAPRVGARFVLEPEWRSAGQIIYKNGIVRSVRAGALDLNHIGSSDIARDKDFAKFFMKRLGFPVAHGYTVFHDEWAKTIGSTRTIASAHTYAKKLGYPVIVKPNSKTQGFDVQVVFKERELRSALRKVFKNDRVAIIERYLPGRDYRIVVLDGEIISAYERIPLSVVGDGKSSVLGLLTQKQKLFDRSGRDTKINFDDPRIKVKLRRQGYAFTSVPPKNTKVFLLDNANLSTGGDAIDITRSIHPSFCKIAAELTKGMGLRIAGVDIMVTKGDITKSLKESNYYIIEINAAPGLDHYVTTGTAQRKIVEAMYLKVLKALGKKD